MSNWFIFISVVISVIGGVIAIVAYSRVLAISRRLWPQLRIRTGNVEIHPKILSEPALNWAVVNEGIDRLRKQVACSSPAFTPDLFVGINRGGAIAATILSFQNRPMAPIAIFRVEIEGNKREIIYSAFPCAPYQIEQDVTPNPFLGCPPEKAKVLLVDEEFKTGSSARVVIDYLSSKWGFNEKNIRIAVLALAGVEIELLRAFREAITIDQVNRVLPPGMGFSAWKDKLLFISYLSRETVSFPWEK